MPDAPRRPPMIDPWFSRLRPVRPEDEALDQLLAEAAETLGFRSAAIVLARETTGEFEYVALHGDEDARELLHTHLARDYVMAQVEAADVLGVVRHLSAETRADLGFVAPGAPRTSARSWHPDDLLMAALKEGADLRGLLVLDDPVDGKAPSDASKARVHDWTRSHCAQVLASDERRRADEGAGLAESAVTILRLLRARHPSPVDRAQACLEALRVALDGRLVLVHLADGDAWRRIDGTVSVPDPVECETWRRALPLLQRLHPGSGPVVLAASRRLGDPEVVDALAEVVELWQQREGSPQLLVLPLSAQRELLGLVAVARSQQSAQWTDLEIALARRICLDLARAV
ncbi:MAG: GAF domain-containing protein [Nocardioides sp.]|nr:GAF domain-containing protein [Nocardioides sp.]